MGKGSSVTFLLWNHHDVQKVIHHLKGGVLCIGNFDGVHPGHRAVINEGRRMAKKLGRPLCVVSFLPHPRLIINPQNFFLLTDLKEKIRAFGDLDVDYVVVFNFSKIMNMEAEDFCDFLERVFSPSCVCTGFDFSFGKGAKGKADDIKRYFGGLGKEVVTVDKVSFGENSTKISSSLLRRLVLSGDVSEYLRLTGRAYSVKGFIARGSGRGRKLGIPTANVITTYQLPQHGVYASFVKLENHDNLLKAVSNVGYQPTFDSLRELLETHILDFSENIYGRKIEVMFLKKIRDVIKFSSAEELRKQINKDIELSKLIFENAKLDLPRRSPNFGEGI